MGQLEHHPFPQTHWSLVHRAGVGDDAARREALSILLVRYRPALQSYMRLRGLDDDLQEELLQGFIADKLLDSDFLNRADPIRGRFRAYLLISLKNYILTWRGYSRIRRTQPLDAAVLVEGAESRPSVAVEAAWARALIREVIAEMERYCQEQGRPDVWTIFEGRLLRQAFGTGKPKSYEELAQELKLASPTTAANLLVTAKRLYTRLLRLAIGEYEAEEADIDSEIADLRSILGSDSSDGVTQ